ncbi:MAG: hypothetical protein H0T89_07080 [Deltaproteobacteria bacterium]|nr:hypothetical protein [Deltaproteobacteria bacterium]MDQ3297269.1 hypothetical protein [Myxococcota bacterium]
MLLGRAAVLVLLAGCPSNDDSDACDVDASTEMMLVYANQLGVTADFADGASLPLVAAPQGGHILLVAPAIRVAGSCSVQINAALRDPASGRVIGLEERPLMLVAHDGWARPPAAAGLSDLANVAVCPTSAVTTPIFDHPYQLELQILDADGHPVCERTAMVVPTCDDEYCRTDCGALP